MVCFGCFCRTKLEMNQIIKFYVVVLQKRERKYVALFFLV